MKLVEQNFCHINWAKRQNKTFKGNDQSQSQYVEKKNESKDSTGAWLGKGIASLIIPGLGQFIDGRNKTGGIHIGLSIGMVILKSILRAKYSSDIVNNKINGNTILLASITGFAQSILHIVSCVESLMNSGKNKQEK